MPSQRNQSIDLHSKSIDLFLYEGNTDNGLIMAVFFNLNRRLTLLWRRSLSYRNQSIDFQSKSMDWFLCDTDLCHERVNFLTQSSQFWKVWNFIYSISFRLTCIKTNWIHFASNLLLKKLVLFTVKLFRRDVS